MSSIADNKNESESKQQQQQQQQHQQQQQQQQQSQQQQLPREQQHQMQQREAREKLQTANEQQFDGKKCDNKKPSESTTSKNETLNNKAITSTITKKNEENSLNKTANVPTLVAQKRSLSSSQPLTAVKSCESKMSPGDAVHQVDSDVRKIIQIEKDNQVLATLGGSKDATLVAYPNETVFCATSESSELSTPTTASSPVSSLSQGLSSPCGSQLPHISSEPTFGVQMRKKQQQNSTNEAIDISETHHDCSGIKTGTVSASASPNMVRKSSESSVVIPRRVSFPKSDHELVTGYLEPANPWVHVCMVKSISEIAELYMTSCQKHNTKPLQCVLDHLKAVVLTQQLRQPLLSLKSIELAPSDCEALEEVLKRVQYKSIDLSDCNLNEIAASALFEIIEYYEATNELDISSNPQGMTHRGWVSCTYMISHSQELQVLNAEGNPISKLSADHLGNALNTSNLHTLKLERCSLKGGPLSGLCFKLWYNRVLKELWIAFNELDSSDADTIADMLKVNHYLELIDISNNNIGDAGLHHIVLSLIMQSKELERRTTFHRAAAIDDDESMSPFESTTSVDLCESEDVIDLNADEWVEAGETKSIVRNDHDTEIRVVKCKKPLTTIDEKQKSGAAAAEAIGSTYASVVSETPKPVSSSFKPPLISTVGSTIEEIDPDEDSDETVRLSSLKNGASAGGQSMLDKLLSMNSESSSEDGVSNLSTDTLAACCSEDASLISDDIFDVSAPATTTITIANANVKPPAFEEHEAAAGTVCAILNPLSSSSVTKSALKCSPRAEDNVANDKRTVMTLAEAVNTVLIEHPAVMPVTSMTTQSSNSTSHVNSNGNNNNKNNVDNNNISTTQTTSSSSAFSGNAGEHIIPTTGIYELKADERHCLMSGPSGGSVESRDHDDHTNILPHLSASKALDVNKNTKLGEDFDDTHSTDSAFESASEGDISRHLPEEFTRLSTSLESTRLDEIAKEFSIETATIASESNECLIAAAAHVTPSSTPTPQIMPLTQISTLLMERDRLLVDPLPTTTEDTMSPTKQVGFSVMEQPTDDEIMALRDEMPKVTIAQDSIAQKYKTNSVVTTSSSQTPPPPSTSPGGVSSGLRRTESTCGFLTQSTRNRSQSTDSLSSDNSLDGSIGSGDLNFSSSGQLNEKLTKNDTLTRQQRQQETAAEASARIPGGLKALALWNNNLSKEAGLHISKLLAETVSLELLNIGKNCLSNEFVSSIKDSLTKNTTLTTLGLQSAHLSAEGIETLTSIMTFGGNSTLQRIDIRGNKVEVESLTKIAEVLKSNTTVTQIDIDDEPKRLSVGSEAHMDYARVLENVRSMCARNEKNQAQMQLERASANPVGKRRGGYYLGSRKISLTCHTRPLVDTSNPVLVTCSAPTNSKLDVKRKPGARLRSPVPSPTTISPSSSPNRASRFQVYRVSEVSPLTSPSIQKPAGGLAGTKAMSSSSVFIQSVSSDGGNVDAVYPNITSTSLPTSSSLPSMATISSSTQSIKRLSVSPRSRFLVRKIDEDPNVPLASRTIPPITPPINPPPTPMSRNTKETTIEEPKEAKQTTDSKSYHKKKDFSDTRAPFMPPTIVTPPTITTCSLTSPPLKSLTQKQNNATTDSCAISIFKVKEIPNSATPSCCEESTNTTANDNITNQLIRTAVADTTCSSSSTIQPSPSILSTLSTYSSSSSSENSASSSTASSSSPSSTSSSSSSSSTSPASNIDTSDSSLSSVASSVHSVHESHVNTQDLTVSGQCPIAVFGDNDITLTKNTFNEALVSAVVSREDTNNVPLDENAAPPATHQQRVRKVSWIANPTAVDKLLTLFHNPFQRSSSPEAKVTIVATPVASAPAGATQLSQMSSDISSLEQQQQQQQQQQLEQQSVSQKSLTALRRSSPPSWSKLGTDILTAAGSNNVNVELANTVATTAAAVVTEQSRSFLDAASKQFRDFSKQVFRQNLSFGNEPVTTAATNTVTSSTVNNPSSGARAEEHSDLDEMEEHVGNAGGDDSVTCIVSSYATSNIACNVGSLPTDVKQEIKENISPEHTINEETLNTMQKLGGGTTSSALAPGTVTTPATLSDLREVPDDLHKSTSWESQPRFGSE